MTIKNFTLSVAIMAFAFPLPINGQVDRLTLPPPTPPFTGVIRENVLDSTPAPFAPLRAPAGAPNILLFMSDDVGFGMSSAFGGPVPMPNMEKLARTGQRYNRFHTTGICSPTRAALLTGRNHHNAGYGYLSGADAGFPGYASRIPPETATIAQVLRLNGYNTAMFGKHHNTPSSEITAAGPFDQWPTGLGFEYFFGMMGGEADQFKPILHRGTELLPTSAEKPVMFERRMADDTIHWLRNRQAAAPDRPFFVYYAPGTAHAPQQAPPEYIARFKGQFNQGWDVMREQTFARQKAQGIVPATAVLTPRPDGIPAWSELSAVKKAFAIRSMEAAAGMLAYQDEQFGRVINELERMGVLNNTLVAVILGDNGAAAEVGPDGSINELPSIFGVRESEEVLAANIEKLGTEETYNSYPAGWAWAMNTPFNWVKQHASSLGGIRNGMILSWSGHVPRPNSVCAEFGHVIDMAPTLLAAAALPAPRSVNGITQKPLDGQNLLPSLANCQADRPRTQYFEMVGKRGLYHDGWFAGNDDGRKAWEPLSAAGTRPSSQWALFDLTTDYAQERDVAAQHPEQLQKMIAIWNQEAAKNGVFPLDHRFSGARSGNVGVGRRPEPRPRSIDFWGTDVSVPAQGLGGTFRMEADLRLEKAGASGVVMALGSHFGGWSLYLDAGRLTFLSARSTRPDEIRKLTASRPLPAGETNLKMTYALERPGGKATVRVSDGTGVLLEGDIASTLVIVAGSGEMLDVGRDTGVTVTTYKTPLGTLEGDVPHLVFTTEQ